MENCVDGTQWFKTETRNGKTFVFDPVRQKMVALTPEEKVRQTVINYLVEKKGVPLRLMASEHLVRVNGMAQRCDIAVFNRNGEPLLLVECKSKTIKIDKSVFDQALRYFSVLKVKYIVLSNGCQTFCLHVSESGIKMLADIPPYSEML